jgi:glycosyltransferase involved in cell wall biosynthesis
MINLEHKPKVSVLVPTYNRSKYLKDAVDSILNQSFVDFEIIIVDNCSNDDTANVVLTYQDSRIQYIFNELNIGAVGNYNKALRLARGEYVYLFSDDDVMSDEDNLKLKVAVLDEYCNVGIVHSSIETIDSNGNVIGGNWAEKNKNWSRVSATSMLLGTNAYNELYNEWNFITMSSVMVRRNILVQYKLEFNNQLVYLIDWNLWLQLSLLADFFYIDRPLIQYRRHSANESLFLDKDICFREILIMKLGLAALFAKNEIIEYNINSMIASTRKQVGLQKPSILSRIGLSNK